jgi:hypothetical protein
MLNLLLPAGEELWVIERYSQGIRVGFYRAGGILAAAGGKCPANYPAATQVSANQINVDGRVRTLSDDCRSGGN